LFLASGSSPPNSKFHSGQPASQSREIWVRTGQDIVKLSSYNSFVDLTQTESSMKAGMNTVLVAFVLLGLAVSVWRSALALPKSAPDQPAAIFPSNPAKPSPAPGVLGPPNPNIDFAYPGASLFESHANTAVYQTGDDPAVVTSWYKTEINRRGLSTTSFIQTSTNDNILNKLVGAKNNATVAVEISRAATDSKTKITVTL
jgi:hypothetical protein